MLVTLIQPGIIGSFFTGVGGQQLVERLTNLEVRWERFGGDAAASNRAGGATAPD